MIALIRMTAMQVTSAYFQVGRGVQSARQKKATLPLEYWKLSSLKFAMKIGALPGQMMDIGRKDIPPRY